MERAIIHDLMQWLDSTDRKPLVLRGGRQVGKTWLVRYFANRVGRELIELNFEKDPNLVSLFNSNDPKQILLNLTTITHHEINPKTTLLFLDEIQVVPELFAKLRWFYEDLPELPVIAAGSLLDFVLGDHRFNMPVGRISYVYVEPLSFDEFLLANNRKNLNDYIASYEFDREIPEAIHQQLMQLLKEYMLVGGLPAAVSSWITERSLQKVHQIQHDLLSTYRDDFAKYKGRIATERLEEVMSTTPRFLGNKCVYSRINPDVQTQTIKQVVHLLENARICHRVRSTAANGVPLSAEVKEKFFKLIFIDTGLCSAALGLNLHQMGMTSELTLVNHGGIAEQLAGQLLRTIEPFYIDPALYCWYREDETSNAEIDYVIAHGNQVIPIEVKAGTTGTLKSLHLFMGIKNLPTAIRINSDFPSKMQVNVKNNLGKQVNYTLFSIPFYLISQIHRLLNSS